MKTVIVLELATDGPDDLEAAVRALQAADIPHLVPVLRVATEPISAQILESINPPKP